MSGEDEFREAPFGRGEEQDVYALTGEESSAPDEVGRAPDESDEDVAAAYSDIEVADDLPEEG